ncbi:MAG: translation elongation factor Ts [Candidatus Omnitrophica bacterium]|nr:translation elongation factor Ts [Candidatus Omnitrophota bacterium]
MATTDEIKKLREQTSAGVMDCKAALNEANGEYAKALEILRKKGVELASKKSSRTTKEGCIASYIHSGGKIGVLLEVNCETDFVARTDDFKALVKDLLLQVCADNPLYVRREDVPEDVIKKEADILKAQVTGKPPAILDKIVSGKLDKYFQKICLLEQPFIKDPSLIVKDYITSVVSKTGENIVVRRFIRYQLGEEI